MPKDALQKWKNWVRDVKEKGLLDGAKTQQLRNCLEKIPIRTMKDAYERVIGDGSKLAGVIRRLTIEAQRKPRDALQRWKQYL
jgi:hypothetical protein